jgi:hypothetical protein
MSFAVSRTAVVAAGARAPPRASAKARVSCAPASRAPSGSFFRATHLRGSPALRAAEDDQTPAPAPAPEELSFPELSDDEEVKGAQITAIITGASRTRTDRQSSDASRSLSPEKRRRGARLRQKVETHTQTLAPSERSRDPDPSSSVSFAFPSNSTGVVSVALAVGYLALVQVIDSREMLPPPPEAMGMGECPPGERRC